MVAINIRQPQAGHPLGFFDAPQPELGWVPLWQTATRNFQLGPVPNLYGAYDFVLESRADLVDVVAPVGGVFNLPDGGYVAKEGFSLDPGERLSIGAGRFVRIDGMRPIGTAIIGDSDAQPLLSIASGSVVELHGLTLVNNGDNFTAVSGGTVNATSTRLTSNGGAGTSIALAVTGATWRGWGNNFTSQQSYAAQINGGNLEETSSNFTSVNANACSVSATASNVKMVACTVSGLFDGMQLTAANAVAELTGCLIQCNTNARSALNIAGMGALVMNGGRLSTGAAGSARNGILIGGNLTRGFLSRVGFDTVNNGINRTAGVQDRFGLANCDFGSTLANGVVWGGGFPPNCLTIVGGSNQATTPWNGFTAATARVNIKCVGGIGALLTETAII